MKKYDVIIVGAGPAGSTAAFYINNLKVLIVDIFDFPRHKACGGGLMSSRDWAKEFENYRQIESELMHFPCDYVKIYWNKTYVTNRKFRHLFDQINRHQFDHLLLKTALEKDNVQFLKFNVQTIQEKTERGSRFFLLSNGKQEISCSYLVGADGVFSKVSAFLGNQPRKRSELGFCLEYDLVCEKKDTAIQFLPGYLGEIGYAWIFPTASGYYLGFGAVRKTKETLQHYLGDLLKWSLEQKIVPENYQIRKTFGGALPLKITKKYCAKNILLCGDAMGTVKTLTGEGIYYAMKSGKIAGEVLSGKRKNIEKEYRKKVRFLIWDVFLTPYIPPKIITLTFWACFFTLGKFLDRLSFITNFTAPFTRLAIHRKRYAKKSFYYKEKITREKD